MRITKKGLNKNRNGGIEGLPLQLMIMVLIAGIGSAVILSWMGNLHAPSTIAAVHSSSNEIVLEDDDADGIFTAEGLRLCITALDQNGDPIEGATVVLEGGSIFTTEGKRPHSMTDAQGKAYFEGLSASHVGQALGFVTVTVAKGGMTASHSITIPVVCE